MMYLSNKKTIMFIPGTFISHACWKEWIVFFENQGYKTVAPPWLFKNESAVDLRKAHPNSKIASIQLIDLLDYYMEIIDKLPEKPILIGHSYGGLLTQLLIQKELGYAGICINSMPPSNLTHFNFSLYKAIWDLSDHFSSTNKTFLMPFKTWQHYFANQMPFQEQKDAYEALLIPESKSIIRNIYSKSAKIDFKKKHNPLLFVSSSKDAFVSVSLNNLNFKKYKNLHSITCYKEFEDSNHLSVIKENWETIAEFIANWLIKIT
ncbi:alpha/beta hydrolase [Flavobacterium sp. LHD-85]|uniref:alpha/beta hydrolase n=1 Tax=Flavobacterium sp. LHD-85 TaxID=3071410 RepID=UPI0027E04ACB|nr:alpha/beta hydrolase [Flavobacterium sp. LHD-85]MDQ6531103.1 alpha/beta hydrolase [Flavobacterium sp. LHD-85]